MESHERLTEPDFDIEAALVEIFSDSNPHTSNTAKSIQFKGEGVRLYIYVPTGETESVTYKIADEEHTSERKLTQPFLVGEYDTLQKLLAAVRTDRQTYEEVTAQERTEQAQQLMDYVGIDVTAPPPREIAVDDSYGLKEFKAGIVQIGELRAAAQEIVDFREATGIDDNTLICGNCNGKGEINIEEDIPHNPICPCCTGIGTIKKNVKLTLINSTSGAQVEIESDVATMVLADKVKFAQDTQERALDNGHIDHVTLTTAILSDFLKEEIQKLGLDPENIGIISDGAFFDGNALTALDFTIGTDSWSRHPDTTFLDRVPGEITSRRTLQQTAGFLGLRKSDESFSARDYVVAAQHALSSYLPSAFSKGSSEKRNYSPELYLYELPPLAESLQELITKTEERGYTLGFSYIWYNGQIFNFFAMDGSDEAKIGLETNYHSLRAAIENAKLALTRI